MKTLDDIKDDMSTLYDSVLERSIDLPMATELWNIAGKFLKAEQLIVQRETLLAKFGDRGTTNGKDKDEHPRSQPQA